MIKTAKIIIISMRRPETCCFFLGCLGCVPQLLGVIPGRVDFTLQVRDLYVDKMEEFVEDVCKKFDLRYEIQHQSEPAI